MSVVAKVLLNKSAEWTEATYENNPYVLVGVAENSVEFAMLRQEFQIHHPLVKVKTIERIQNPYLFGLFFIRMEQLKCQLNGATPLVRKYISQFFIISRY